MATSGIVTIHGKEYQTVALRVKNFREKYPDFPLITEIISRDDECVVMKATIQDQAGRPLATGHSEEYRSASQINSTSALENAETSAIGRALAALGMGGTEFASADEVANAIGQQKATSVAQDAWSALTLDQKTHLNDIAAEVRKKPSPADQVAVIEGYKLDADLKVALWSRFNSKERSAMKASGKKAA